MTSQLPELCYLWLTSGTIVVYLILNCLQATFPLWFSVYYKQYSVMCNYEIDSIMAKNSTSYKVDSAVIIKKYIFCISLLFSFTSIWSSTPRVLYQIQLIV